MLRDYFVDVSQNLLFQTVFMKNNAFLMFILKTDINERNNELNKYISTKKSNKLFCQIEDQLVNKL